MGNNSSSLFKCNRPNEDSSFEWDISELRKSKAYLNSQFFSQKNEHFCCFYSQRSRYFTVYCCSAEQWSYDESFNFKITLVNKEDLSVIAETIADFSKNYPFCSIFISKLPDNIEITIDICSIYPYVVRERFLGIKNSGATCYMASTVQILYYTVAFRNLIYSFKDNEIGNEYSVLELQNLFKDLQLSSRAPSLDKFINSYGSASELAYIQHDAHEFFVTLLTRLESKLGVMFKDLKTTLFDGETTTTITCSQLNYKTVKKENFVTVPVTVDGLRSLGESLSLMTNSQKLSDSYQTEDGRVGEALSEMKFSNLPSILVFHLCRFKYTTTEGGKSGKVVEIKTPFDCPFNLDMKNYSSDIETETNYTLYGIIAHSGNPTFGHYTSYIRPFNGETWVLFNDGYARIVDEKSILKLFGTINQNQPSFFRHFTGQSALAYILFYIRSDSSSYLNQTDFLPYHIAPHRSNYLLCHIVTYSDLKGTPVNITTPPFVSERVQSSIAEIIRLYFHDKTTPKVANDENKETNGTSDDPYNFSNHSVWIQMPGRSHFIGPLPLSANIQHFYIKGLPITLFILPKCFDIDPVFIVTEKLPKTYVSVVTNATLYSLYQGKALFCGKIPLKRGQSKQLPAGSLVHISEPKIHSYLIKNRRYHFSEKATYSDARYRISEDYNIDPSKILIMSGSTFLKPKDYRYVTDFNSLSKLSFQDLTPFTDLTVNSISLFTPLLLCIFDSDEPRIINHWIRKGTSVDRLKEVVKNMYLSETIIPENLVVSKGCKERIETILPNSHILKKDSLRIDLNNSNTKVHTDLRSLKEVVKPKKKNANRKILVEVRFSDNELFETFVGCSRFMTIDNDTKVRDIIDANSLFEKSVEVFFLVTENTKKSFKLNDDQANIFLAIKDSILGAMKKKQRMCIVLVVKDSVSLIQNIPIVKSSSLLLRV